MKSYNIFNGRTFDGVITGFSTSADLEDVIGFSMTIKVSGQPVFAAGTGA